MTKQVLVAEDEPMDVFLLQRGFAESRIAISLHFVEDGQAAIDYLSGAGQYADRTAHPLPDLMLLDIKMPRLDGFEVLGWLRQQPGLKRLPVAMFSSCDLEKEVNRAYELGANSFLVKPQELTSMSDFVRRFEEYWLQLNRGPQGLQD
jgi:CheY-like chemotaxis protein